MTEFERQKFEIEELLLLLEPYTEGELSFLLNATENVDIVHDRLIAFDMEDASKKEYFPLVAIITLQMIVDKIKKRQGFAKELIIDEALDFLQDEKFGDFIAYLYRTFRKKEGSITLAAQNILFLKNMPASIKDSIIINCATKIILDHSEHRQNLPEVKAVLSITDEEIYMIESLQRTERWREFFIKMSNDASYSVTRCQTSRRSFRLTPGNRRAAEAIVQRKRLDLYGHQPLSGGKEKEVWMMLPKA